MRCATDAQVLDQIEARCAERQSPFDARQGRTDVTERQDPVGSSNLSDVEQGTAERTWCLWRRDFRLPALALACVISFGLAVNANEWAKRNSGIDYYQWWLVKHWLAQGGDYHIYGEANQYRLGEFAARQSLQRGAPQRERAAALQNLKMYDGRIELYASPFLYACLSAIATGDYERDIGFFTLTTILAYAAAIGFLGWSLRYTAVTTVLAIAVLMYNFLPLRSLLQVGNVAGIQLLPIALFVGMQARQSGLVNHIVSGLFIGAAIAFKPSAAFVLVPPAIVWAIDLDLRRAVSIGTGALVASGLAFACGGIFFGSTAVWSEWLADVLVLLGQGPTASSFNCSIPGVVEHEYGVRIGLPLLVVFLVLVGLAAGRTRLRRPMGTSVWAPLPSSSGRRTALAAALGGVLGLFVFSLTWYHYLIIGVPLILWTWRPLETGGRWILVYRAVALVALVLLTTLPLESGLSRRFVELWLGNAALILVTGLGLLDLAFRASDLKMASRPSNS